MKKYLWMLSAAVMIGALRIKSSPCKKTVTHAKWELFNAIESVSMHRKK